jgi:hypothetical protein
MELQVLDQDLGGAAHGVNSLAGGETGRPGARALWTRRPGTGDRPDRRDYLSRARAARADRRAHPGRRSALVGAVCGRSGPTRSRDRVMGSALLERRAGRAGRLAMSVHSAVFSGGGRSL